MDSFTPFSSLAGGALIGLAAVALMALNGRIAGISGIFGGAFLGNGGDRGWRWSFLAGLVLAPLLYGLIAGPPPFVMEADLPLAIAAGLLVGIGTRLGAGCTSGHGVCGIARLSPRSLAATGLFMAAGFVTVGLTRHVVGG